MTIPRSKSPVTDGGATTELPAVLQQIAAEVVLLTPQDHELRQQIEAMLRSLVQTSELPERIKDPAREAVLLLQKLVQTPNPDACLTQLEELLDRMLSAEAENATVAASTSDRLEPEDGIPAQKSVQHGKPESSPTRVFKVPAEIDWDLAHEFRTESAEHLQQAEQSLMNLEHDPNDLEAINTLFRAFHTVKGVSGFVGLSYITELAHKAESFFDHFRKGQAILRGVYSDLAFEAVDMLKCLLAQINEVVEVGCYSAPSSYDDLIARLEHPELQSEVSAPPAASLQREAEDNHPLGETVANPKATPAQDELRSPRTLTDPGKKLAAVEGTVKVSTSRLDNLINLAGELIMIQSMVSRDLEIQNSANQRLASDVERLNKIARSLQEHALSMRMVSMKPTFQRMSRLARDLARKFQKEILFETAGEDTEVDRNLAEAIADPLIHMLRNAADHGIESPLERESCGKSQQGRIVLQVAREGGMVVLTLQDDGRGLNLQKIKAKAVERGLIDANALLTEAEVCQLIFLPGLSTTEEVTDVSGRGVGLDVVRTNVHALLGSVEVESKLGKGSIFRIRLPQTIAIVDGTVLRVGSERYLLPTAAITDTRCAPHEDLSTVQTRPESVLIHGKWTPLCRLHQVFHIAGAVEEIKSGILVVVESRSRRIALLADELLGRQRVVVREFGSTIGEVKGISGRASLGDGAVCSVLDVEELSKLCEVTRT